MEASNTTDPAGAARNGRRTYSAIGLLADRPSLAILLTLGEARARGIEALPVTEQSLADATPRLIRDRLRILERVGVVEAVDRAPAGVGAPSRWALTSAGRDLYRLQALMVRIISHAAELHAGTPAVVRQRAVEIALTGLADPVITQIARGLATAGHPLDPVALEEACQPVPRRTLYRRLGPLVDSGVVVRTAGRTVPRSTSYELAERWRPVAAIPVLAAWWEGRHWSASQLPDFTDLEGILHAILPMARIDRARSGQTLRWTVEQPGGATIGAVAVEGDRLTVLAGGAAGNGSAPPVNAAASGTPTAWATAMVTDRGDDLVITGDESLAREAINAVRAALLAYVR